jgi:FG-GAP-like repeat
VNKLAKAAGGWQFRDGLLIHMHASNFNKLFAGIGVIFCGAVMVSTGRADDVTNRFGFTGPEIFPIDNQIGLLRAADLDGDGLNDLIVVNNSRSKIDLLYNQTGKTNAQKRADSGGIRREINELPPDARFRLESISSEKRISSLVVADLNGDGKPDIAYFGGDPKELVVLYNQGTNGWSTPKHWPVDDGQLTPNALSVGDLNGDGLNDLVLLGDPQVYVFKQKPDHTLADPEKIPYSGTVKAIEVLDIDGDGRKDLLLVNWDSPAPFRFRLQNDSGRLGPEIHFTLDPIRAFTADNLEGDKKAQIITIAMNSGRAQVSEFTRQPAPALSGAFKQGQFQVMPLNRSGDRSRRGVLWADVNGDGLPDLLVAEPDSGQISIFLQKPDGTLDAPKEFSTLTGVSDLAVADWNGDGKPDIFLLSTDERQIGVTHMDEKGRLPFPTLIPLEGKPLAMAVGRPRPKDKVTLAVIVADQNERRSLVTRTADGKGKTQKLSESFKSNPSTMMFHDVNQDGLMDLVVLIPYEKIKVLLQVDDKDYDEEDIAPPGGTVEEPWMSTADVDGDGKPELLLAQRNFLRAVVLKQEAAAQNSTNRGGWVFSVKEQINGADSSSRLVGAAALPNGTNAVNSLFLLDAERKALTLCERDSAGAWQVIRNLPLPYTAFNSLQPISLGGTKPNGVAFLGKDAAGWMPMDGSIWALTNLDSYETPIKDGRLNDVVAGDLDNDGRKDLVFLETAKNYLDLVIFDKNRKLVPANRWPVFEERSFRSRRSDLPEPREALVVDVTGDGKNDLVIIVHDRILVYPQQ